jgi:hypothetical protein
MQGRMDIAVEALNDEAEGVLAPFGRTGRGGDAAAPHFCRRSINQWC